jgi:hypothetical protein
MVLSGPSAVVKRSLRVAISCATGQPIRWMSGFVIEAAGTCQSLQSSGRSSFLSRDIGELMPMSADVFESLGNTKAKF